MMKKAVLHNCMALDILTAFQGGTCAIIQTKSYVVIPDEFSKITHLVNHMKSQISAFSDPFPSLDDLLKKKLVCCGRFMAKLFTFNSTNVINYTICILLFSQDYYFLYYRVYD